MKRKYVLRGSETVVVAFLCKDEKMKEVQESKLHYVVYLP
jgi:hypothetical protein